MVDNIVSKPLRLVLIFTAHMVFNGTSQAEVTRILGTNITLEFKFNISVSKHFAVYKNHTKIAEYSEGKISSNEGNFDSYRKNKSVFFCIANLKLNHSGLYWASLFMDSGFAKESNNKEKLIVQEENKSSTVPSKLNDITTNEDSGSHSHIVTVLVVSPVVLLAAALPLLVWCLVRTNDKQPPSQQSSNPTVQSLQETVEASYNVPAPPLIYSVLDFPKRPSAVLETHPSDTEYASVNYLPEKRQV